MFPVQMATSGIHNRFWQHGLQIAERIVTYVILSDMSVFGASVQRTNLEIMSFLRCNTPGRFATYIERSPIPPPRQLMPNTGRTVFTKDSTCFNIFPVS